MSTVGAAVVMATSSASSDAPKHFGVWSPHSHDGVMPVQDPDALCAAAEAEQAELRARLTAATQLLPKVALERPLKVLPPDPHVLRFAEATPWFFSCVASTLSSAERVRQVTISLLNRSDVINSLYDINNDNN